MANDEDINVHVDEEDVELSAEQIAYLEMYLQSELDEESDLAQSGLRLVSFVSSSAGKGKKRQPREIELLVVPYGDGIVCFQVDEDTIRPRPDIPSIHPDELAQDLLTTMDESDKTTDRLLNELRAMKERRSKRVHMSR